MLISRENLRILSIQSLEAHQRMANQAYVLGEGVRGTYEVVSGELVGVRMIQACTFRER